MVSVTRPSVSLDEIIEVVRKGVFGHSVARAQRELQPLEPTSLGVERL